MDYSDTVVSKPGCSRSGRLIGEIEDGFISNWRVSCHRRQAESLSNRVDYECFILILHVSHCVIGALLLHLVSKDEIRDEKVIEKAHDADTVEAIHHATVSGQR